MWTRGTTAIVVALTLAIPASLAAQIDYRNLDRGRPVETEDAYPVERHAFELLLPFRSAQEWGGQRLHLLPLEIEYGVAENAQVGLAFPVGASDGTGTGTKWGLAGLSAFILYNFNTEGPVLPAISIGADVGVPVGALAGEGTRVSLKAIATRSWGQTRLHLNAVRSFGSEEAPGVEFAPRWSYSLGMDRTLFRQSMLLIGEVLTQREVRGAPVEVNAAIGARYQLTPTLVLDAGVGRRLRSRAGPDYDLTIGLSHAFGLSWLLPGRSR
jgi:hypothetical protein